MTLRLFASLGKGISNDFFAMTTKPSPAMWNAVWGSDDGERHRRRVCLIAFVDDPGEYDRRLTIRGGRMAVPAGPGLGVTLDADKFAGAAQTYTKCGMRGRDDRSLMRRIEPGWTGELR
jgi:hypothetical protein